MDLVASPQTLMVRYPNPTPGDTGACLATRLPVPRPNLPGIAARRGAGGHAERRAAGAALQRADHRNPGPLRLCGGDGKVLEVVAFPVCGRIVCLICRISGSPPVGIEQGGGLPRRRGPARLPPSGTSPGCWPPASSTPGVGRPGGVPRWSIWAR